MSAESLRDSSTPPMVMGDVDIARFPSSGEATERWRVSVGGRVHFLSDADTARRIYGLAHGDNYARAHEIYSELAGAEACDRDVFVAWSETHRSQLEELAVTPDGHPLKFRHRLVSEVGCERLARRLAWLFRRIPAALLLLVSASMVGRFVAISPAHWQGAFWLAIPLALCGILVHEIGHITACVRYGAKQGGIGIGLYWIWPAFYADVRGSWSLPARQRLQVSAGGLYFQSMYAALLATLGMATGDPMFGMALQITLLLMAMTCNPVFKYDGYWILADLFNITNIHTRIASHLKGLLHARESDRLAMLASRWTWLSAIFATGAVGFIAYIGVELFHSASMDLQHLARNWRDLTSHTMRSSPMHLWLSTGALVLRIILVGVAIMVLGTRSLRATASIFQGRGERQCQVESRTPSGSA